MRVTESQLRRIVSEEVAQHQDPSGRWLEDVWVGEADGDSVGDEAATVHRRGGHRTSAGSVAAIKKSGGSMSRAIERGKFDWADDPAAAAASAEYVATGHWPGEKKKHENVTGDKMSLKLSESGLRRIIREEVMRVYEAGSYTGPGDWVPGVPDQPDYPVDEMDHLTQAFEEWAAEAPEEITVEDIAYWLRFEMGYSAPEARGLAGALYDNWMGRRA